MGIHSLAKEVEDAFLETADGQLLEKVVARIERKFHLGMCQRYSFKFTQNMVELGLVRLEKFSAGGDVKEEVAYEEVGSNGAGHRSLFLDMASFYKDGCA